MMSMSTELRVRTLGVLRPGVETLLLAAVALGCAQAGWSLLAPKSATASGAPANDGAAAAAPQRLIVETPFTPAGLGASDTAYAVTAVLSNVQVAGLRASTDPARSGAILTLDGGVQAAFLVGDEVAPGVRLTAVDGDGVVLSFAGGERKLAMPKLEQFSYSAALMGVTPLDPAVTGDGFVITADPGRAVVTAVKIAPDLAPASAMRAPIEAASFTSDGARVADWIAQAMLAQAPGGDGLRVPAGAPAQAASFGIEEGDLIVAINGAPASDLKAVAKAGLTEDVVLEIVRDGERRTVTLQGVLRS